VPNSHEPLLINTLGHSAGALIFGIFLFLLLRDRRGSWLSVAAGGLAFAWNACSLIVVTGAGIAPPIVSVITAFAFSALSLLPAVLLHLSLKGELKAVVLCGYATSAVAVVMHFVELVRPGPDSHRLALLLITVGFSALTIAAVVISSTRERVSASRIITAMCLALFSMSFIHFSPGEPRQAWSSELAFHHAGIPLALFILLHDYRFVLLDAFIRFLANVLLAALLAFGVIRATGPHDPSGQLSLFAGICLLLILFAFTRGLLQRWLTRVVFRRPDLERSLHKIRSRPAGADDTEYLAWAAQHLAQFVETEEAEVVPDARIAQYLGSELAYPAPSADMPQFRAEPAFQWVEALVPLRLSEGELRYALLGRRRGGRRYLSEDLESLDRLARAMVEQFERFRASEMQRLVSQAELRALQSQINPHFLFNALNTLYGIIPRKAEGARRTVLNLAEIFRYFLQSERTFIPLSEEVQIIKAYLEIEKLRLGERLRTEIDIDKSALSILIPILSIEPLVENAVKHGVATSSKPERVRLEVRALAGEVQITVENTGGGRSAGAEGHRGGAGVGLANVSRRLQLCYGPDATLRIESGPEGTIVRFSVPLAKVIPVAV
jgi:two-component system LytT family sensor kinase